MNGTHEIRHEGIVVKVEGQEVTVRFVQSSACSACHAKALCSGGSSDSAERQIVANSYGVSYQVGEQVSVIVSSGLAWSAAVIAFGIPLALGLACLFVAVNSSGSEVLGSIITLAVLLVYYLIVWCFRHRLEHRVEFLVSRS